MTPALVRRLPTLAMPGTAAAMIAVASSQIGYREGANNDNVFGRWYGMNHAAWCAMFVSWAAAHSGNATAIPRHAYTPAGAAWFRARDQWGTKPRVGAIAYFYGPAPGGPRIHHVAPVVKLLGGSYFQTVEGNTNDNGSRTGNGVYTLRRSGVGGSRGGFGYPKYLPGRVDLTKVLAGVRTTRKYTGVVAAALAAEKLTADVTGYAAWQRKLGYVGRDADGYAGFESLSRLGAKHGFTVQR